MADRNLFFVQKLANQKRVVAFGLTRRKPLAHFPQPLLPCLVSGTFHNGLIISVVCSCCHWTCSNRTMPSLKNQIISTIFSFDFDWRAFSERRESLVYHWKLSIYLAGLYCIHNFIFVLYCWLWSRDLLQDNPYISFCSTVKNRGTNCTLVSFANNRPKCFARTNERCSVL